MSREVWLEAVGYEGLYAVSSRGRVKRLAPGRNTYPGKILNQYHATTNTDHLAVYLCKDGKQKGELVHCLVLKAFVGPCPPGFESLHKNGTANDNRAANLRWGTHAENMRDKIRHGTSTICLRGTAHPKAKLNPRKVRGIRTSLRHGICVREIAKKLDVGKTTIYAIAEGRTWKHVT